MGAEIMEARTQSQISSGQKPRIRMLVPLWGPTYFNRWLDLPAASLRSPNNIPYLQRHAEFELVFLTKAQDVPFLMNNPAFKDLAAHIPVKTITIDEFFPVNGGVPYGVPLTLAYAKGVKDLGHARLGTFIILMNADFLLSDGSLASLFDRIQQGFHIITAPSIRVVDHLARPLLADQLLLSRDLGQGFASRNMMSVVNEYLHQTVTARIINRPQLVEAWYYHMIFWKISPECLAARYFLLMPFCFQVRRQVDFVTCPVDYGFIEQVCPGGRYTVLADSDEFLMVELQDRDSEAYLLEPADSSSRGEGALERKLSRIAANAGTWSTFEHRRAAAHTLLFHSQDLPADIDDRVSEFAGHMSRVLTALPPPTPVQRHFHWLGALHDYRAAMAGHGLGAYPTLLLHEANRIVVDLVEPPADCLLEAKPQWPPVGRENPAIDIIEHLRPASTIITLDGLVAEVSSLGRSARIFPMKIGDAHHHDLEMRFAMPNDFVFDNTTLGVYLLIDSLALWPKLRHLCDAALSAGGRVILLFRTTSWTDMKLRDNVWILSLLLYFFRSETYSAELTLISLPLGESVAWTVKSDGTDWFPSESDEAYLGFVVSLTAPGSSIASASGRERPTAAAFD